MAAYLLCVLGYSVRIRTRRQFLAEEEAHIVECAALENATQPTSVTTWSRNPRQKWFSNPPCDEDPWPDAGVRRCEELFLEEEEWNDKNSDRTAIRILCDKATKRHELRPCPDAYRGAAFPPD